MDKSEVVTKLTKYKVLISEYFDIDTGKPTSGLIRIRVNFSNLVQAFEC